MFFFVLPLSIAAMLFAMAIYAQSLILSAVAVFFGFIALMFLGIANYERRKKQETERKWNQFTKDSRDPVCLNYKEDWFDV